MFDIVETNTTERFWIEAGSAGSGEDDGGIAAQSGGVIDGSIVTAEEVEVGFGPCDEEGFGRLETEESLEIDVSSIHDIVGAGFEGKLIEDGHVVRFALRNVYKTGDIATEIKERVKFDCRFATPKLGPGKECQAEINGGGIECVDGLVQSESERLVDVERAGLRDQNLGEVVKDAPVMNTVGVGQSASRDRPTKAGVVAFTTDGVQAGDDVPEASAESQLGESQGEKLIAAGETAWPTMTAITSNAGIEIVPRKVVHQLGEHELTGEHGKNSTLRRRASSSGFWHSKFRSCAPYMIRKT